MISTVTITVSTIVSTIVSSSLTGLLASLGAAGVLTLISALVIKELVSGEGVKLTFLGRNLDIIVLPLIFVFSFIVSVKVWEVLS